MTAPTCVARFWLDFDAALPQLLTHLFLYGPRLAAALRAEDGGKPFTYLTRGLFTTHPCYGPRLRIAVLVWLALANLRCVVVCAVFYDALRR